MTDLLKEAIADAKAVKDVAIESAKLQLEEAFMDDGPLDLEPSVLNPAKE